MIRKEGKGRALSGEELSSAVKTNIKMKPGSQRAASLQRQDLGFPGDLKCRAGRTSTYGNEHSSS